MFGPPGVATRVQRGIGIPGVPMWTIENACASGTSAHHEAGPRQVARDRVGMVETMGGGAAGTDGNACVVAILSAR